MKRSVVALTSVVLCACTSVAPMPAPEPTFTPDATVGPPAWLIYVEGTTLKTYDIASGASERITRLPSADVAVSPDGLRLVATRETHPEGPGAEGFRRPELVIASTDAQEDPSSLGPGRSPLWAPNSSAVAAIASSGGGEEIVVYQIPGGKTVTAAPSEQAWSLVGWQDLDVVAIGGRNRVVRIPSFGDELTRLRVAPPELWGVSPAGGAYLAIGRDAPAIVAPEARRKVRVQDGVLGDGTWSLDGARIAAVVLDGARSTLVMVDTSTGKVRDVPAGDAAQGNVVWSLDSQMFAFVRVDPSAQGRLQAVVCTVKLECDVAFDWREGVRLLAFR